MRPRVNAGALCSTGAASSALTPPAQFWFALLRALDRWIGGSVLIEYARAVRRSNAMIWARVMNLRRECGCSGVRSRGTE